MNNALNYKTRITTKNPVEWEGIDITTRKNNEDVPELVLKGYQYDADKNEIIIPFNLLGTIASMFNNLQREWIEGRKNNGSGN